MLEFAKAKFVPIVIQQTLVMECEAITDARDWLLALRKQTKQERTRPTFERLILNGIYAS